MVGYGGGAYVLTMMDRSGLIEPNDCGDGMGNKSSGRALSCATDMPGKPGDPGNPSNPAAPTAEELPYSDACLCSVQPGRARGPVRGIPSGVALFSAAVTLLWLRRRGARRGAMQQGGGR